MGVLRRHKPHGRVQTKPGYQEPERNQEAEYLLISETGTKPERPKFSEPKPKPEPRTKPGIQAEILGSIRNFLEWPVILGKTKN